MTLMEITMVAVTTASILVSVFLVVMMVIIFKTVQRLQQSLNRVDALITQGLMTSQAVHETVVGLISKLEGVTTVLSVSTVKRIIQTMLGRKEHHERSE